MVWFKMDDKFHSAKPVMQIPRSERTAAIGLFALAGTWSADHLTDGFIPGYMIEELSGTMDAAAALVAARLWKKKGDGFAFREWSPWQPTRADVEQARKSERDRKAAYRANKPGNSGSVPGNVPPGQNRNPGTPDPTRPDHIRDSSRQGAVVGHPVENGGGHQHVDKGVDNYATAIEAFAEEFDIPRLSAGIAVDWILARSKSPVTMPRRYVRRAINRDRPIWERFARTEQLPE